MIFAPLLGLLAFFAQINNQPNTPLVSATNPFYLSCTYWDGKSFTDPASRSAKTPISESKNGYRAYGEVQVMAKDGDCENTTTLFVAKGKDVEFKVVYRTKDGGGNGIRMVGWSPNGQRLLAELNKWAYFSDTGFEGRPLVYNSADDSTTEFTDLDKTVLKYFGSECDFEHSVRRWQSDSQIVVRISQAPASDEYEQHFCVKSPMLLLYDLDKRAISSLTRATKKFSK
jgi:hypothetical protein